MIDTVTVVDQSTGTKHELDGLPAQIVLTLCEGLRLLPLTGKLHLEFECADTEIVMSPRLSFRRKAKQKLT